MVIVDLWLSQLMIYILRRSFTAQSRTGGDVYLRDKNTCAGTLAENGKRGLICERGHIHGTLRYMNVYTGM